MKKGITYNDQLGFTLTNLNFKTKAPEHVAFFKASDVPFDLLWSIFGRLIQSNTKAEMTNNNLDIMCSRVSAGNKGW